MPENGLCDLAWAAERRPYCGPRSKAAGIPAICNTKQLQQVPAHTQTSLGAPCTMVAQTSFVLNSVSLEVKASQKKGFAIAMCGT
mmetsp:Transcript_142641/g.248734  ORF Transcript_142641/g.248734 Transcript_142641/m.248734 type:complete len:85 (+) Transcript_142641:57-311(+)